MSRIGKLPIKLPEKVKASIAGSKLNLEGPKGKMELKLAKGVVATTANGELVIGRADDTVATRSLHGLSRTLVSNAVHGVTNGWERTLEINGVGFKAEMKGKKVQFTLGYSHVILFEIPAGITIDIQKEGKLVLVKGVDKELVGSVASQVRAMRVPDPYKAYGVKYLEETVRRKEGKTGAA